MIHFAHEDRQMLEHLSESRVGCLADYTDHDERVADKVGQVSKIETGSLVVTGEVLNEEKARHILSEVIEAELNHWIPGASQRLIYRASRALEMSARVPITWNDCGNEPHWHALVRDWIAGKTYMRCATCHRLYKG